MLSDTDVACVTIALALCLVHGKESPLDQRVVLQTKTTIRKNAHTYLVLSETNDYKILSYGIRWSII